MPSNIYITSEEFGYIVEELNYAASSAKQDDLLRRAVGDFEADMSMKFVVPLKAQNGPFANAPEYAKTKVYSALKAKLKELIGFDQNRNLTGTVEGTEKFLNVHGQEYASIKKSLLDHKIDYKFELLDYAADSQTPVQKLRLSRANNAESTEADD